MFEADARSVGFALSLSWPLRACLSEIELRRMVNRDSSNDWLLNMPLEPDMSLLLERCILINVKAGLLPASFDVVYRGRAPRCDQRKAGKVSAREAADAQSQHWKGYRYPRFNRKRGSKEACRICAAIPPRWGVRSVPVKGGCMSNINKFLITH